MAAPRAQVAAKASACSTPMLPTLKAPVGGGGWTTHYDCGSGVDQRVVADACRYGASSSRRAAPMALKAGPKNLTAGRSAP